MTLTRFLAALVLLLGTAVVMLVYTTLDDAVTETYCADEAERLLRRERVIQKLAPSLYANVTRQQLERAIEQAQLGEEAFPKGPHELIVSGIGFVFDGEDRLREISFD